VDKRLDGLTIQEAAAKLGIAPEAVRKRLKRGSLEGYKADGRWLVILPDQDADWTRVDSVQDAGMTRPDNGQDATTRELIDALKAEVTFLRRELETRTEAHGEEVRRKDHIIAAFTQRIPELPPPRETREHKRRWWWPFNQRNSG
jgi:hypothetical protein